MSRDKLKVMIVGPGLRTEGGITEVIRRIFSQLDASPNIDVVWVAMHRSGNALQKIGAALTGFLKSVWLMPGSDIAHIHSAADISFFRKSIVYWIARLFRKPVIWHLHSPNADFERFFGGQGLAGKYARHVISHCAKVVVLSESWRALASPYVDAAKLAVIENPIPEIPAASDSAMRQARRVLYLAHLIPRKGYSLLIEAFAKAAAEHPDALLVFAGSGEVDNAKRICEELNITDRVEFLGWVGDEQRDVELRKASVFVLPSFQEGLPMGILESMAYGLATIVTPVGGIPDVVIDGENGLLMETGSVDSLTDALRRALADPDLCGELGRRAQQAVGRLSPQRIAVDWQRLYREILPGSLETVFDEHRT